MAKRRTSRRTISFWKRIGKWGAAAVGTSVIGAIILFLVNWLGLNPSTTDIQPLGASIPIKVYSTGVETLIFQYGSIWAAFRSPPSALMSPDEVSAIVDWDPLITFTGEVSIYLDVESVASKYGIIVHSIDLAIQQEQPDSVTNLMYLPPAMGGGGYMEYELSLSNSAPISKNGTTKIYRTKLVSGDGQQSFDFISLAPAERQSVRVDVLLNDPGKYTITPIINYSFREKSSSVYTSPFKVIYPRFYEGWSNGRDSGPLKSTDLIVELQTGRINQVLAPPKPQKECLPTKGQIAFSSSMLTFGELGNVFLYNFSDNNIYEASPFSFQSKPNVTLRDDYALVGVWGYNSKLKREVPDVVYAFDLTAFSGRIIAAGQTAAEYEDILKPHLDEKVTSSVFDDLWHVEITDPNERENTKLMISRVDGTCRTTLISMPHAYLTSLIPFP